MNAVTAALLALITGATIVSATVYPYLNASYQTPVGVRTLKNVNFPFSFQEYQITSFPNVAGFYPPDYGLGPCRLGGYNISTGLDPTTKLNATIAFISILDAYNAGCPRYTWVAYANGWHRECPEGTDIRKLLETPGDVPCSTPETRPQLALWMQLGPVDNRCCPDIFFARSTPMNGYLNEESQSLVPQTGISIDDMVYFSANNIIMMTVTSEGAQETYSATMATKGFDAYMVGRQIVSLVYIIAEMGIMALTARQEGFKFNLKWGILIGIFIMTLCTTSLHSMYLVLRPYNYELSKNGTPTQISLMCFGFMFGYESLAMMLQKWLTTAFSGQGSMQKPWHKTALRVYKYFIFFTMAWLPIITCACVASIVLADNVDKLATFYKLFDTLCGSLAFSLLIHSVGFLYSGYKLTNAMNVGKMLQAHASGSSKANLSSVAREQPKRKKSGLTVTVRNLMIAVVVGWTLLAIDLILNWALTLQSAFGFWNFVYYDLNVAWIAAASYLAMSAGMMETVMITQQTTSKGKRSGAEVSGKAINASQRSLGNGAEDVLEVA